METMLPATLTLWITQYGSLALFALLALGIFALPIPDETLMLFAGVLIAHGKLLVLPTFIAASTGAIMGISISYLIGRTVGAFMIRRYGYWIGITDIRIQRVHLWFERVGRWALFLGYFVPGIRHVTGYAAGVTSLAYRQFALFAYSGAFVWALTFLSLGYFVGDSWERIEALLYQYWYYLVPAATTLLVMAVYLYWRKKRSQP